MSMKWTTSTKKNYRVLPLSKRLPTRIKFNLLIIVFGMQKDFDPLKIFMHIHLSLKTHRHIFKPFSIIDTLTTVSCPFTSTSTLFLRMNI